MKKSEVKVGGHYKALISGVVRTVRVDKIREVTTYRAGKRASVDVYDVTNLTTGRTATFKSAAKFRSTVKSLDRLDEGQVQAVVESEEAEHRSDPTPARTEPTPLPLSVVVAAARPAEGSLSAKFASSPTASHLIIEARAGTGKTTTLVAGLQLLKGGSPTDARGNLLTPSPQQAAVWEELKKSSSKSLVTFAAFNKSIATELQNRVPTGCQAMTIHSLGSAAVRQVFGRQEPTQWAVKDITAELSGMNSRDMQRMKPVVLKAVDRLVSLCKMNLIDLGSPDGHADLDTLSSYYDIELEKDRKEIFELVPQVLEKCRNPQGKITFDDMIWLPVTLGLSVPKSDLLLVDEAQDLNRCQQALAKRAGHRLVLCGDPNQAIYGFAGADSESMERMEKELQELASGCGHLPLTVTRRCGKAIVQEARQYVSDFQAHESNPEGLISSARYPFKKNADGKMEEIPWADSYMPKAEAGDMVLCRMNAPLVSNCFRFLKRGIKATIQGREVGQGLISTIEKLCKHELVPVVKLVGLLSDWHTSEEAKEQAKKNPSETKLTGLQDRYECLMCFTDGVQHSGEVIGKIDKVFTDAKDSPGIKLSSIHKAKGLEANRVFFLKPPMSFTRKRPMQRWESQQEENLEYVAITRAIQELCYVR